MIAYFRCPSSFLRLIKRTIRGTLEHDCFGLAAELAYYFFLAIFPGLIFAVALLGFLPIEKAIQPMLDRLSSVAPSDVVQIVGLQFRQIAEEESGGLLTFGMLGAIWSSSAAVSAIITTLNKVYNIRESRPWWRVKLQAILITLGLIAFLLFAMLLVLVGPVIAKWMDSTFNLGVAVITAWNIVRWIGAFFFAVLAVDIVYNFGPDAETKWTWITPGSLVATILWIAGSLGFRLYLAYFGNYNATYGAIGGIIVLLLWFYLSGLSILIGAELDAKIDEDLMESFHIAPQPGERRKIGAALEI